MALTTSNELPLLTEAPDFYLPDTNGNHWKSLTDCRGEKGTLVMFICNHCPYVHHVLDEIIMIANDYRVQGIGFVAISSNDIENYPADSPENMAEFAYENNFHFPYLYDETQETAKVYQAACTPDFYCSMRQTGSFITGNSMILDRGTIFRLVVPTCEVRLIQYCTTGQSIQNKSPASVVILNGKIISFFKIFHTFAYSIQPSYLKLC